MKYVSRVVCLVLLVAAFAMAQPAATEPSMFMTIGAGGSPYSDLHYGVTGSFGVRVADGTFSLTSLDMGTKMTAAQTRSVVSTMRTGLMKRLIQSGAVGVYAAVDAGMSAGGGSTVGAVSGGGTVTYDIPKHSNLFAFGSMRVLRSPQNDPAASNPAVVQTAFTMGIGLKLMQKE